jgi:hypothetical protein
MGYMTTFTGQVSLSRALTFAEAKELIEMSEDSDLTQQNFGLRNYMQWVPTESLDAIVWDGNEKFYDYTPLMQKLCDWLLLRGVVANGELLWRGESADDVGSLLVVENVATARPGKKAKVKSGTPLTMARLGEMALEQLTDKS